ncbi:inorganic diphosphatase [Aequorivita echinoideorum]|uniref:inorganic diphosphatase n=2 Tax=Aequorivita echinoideorum TaxID=1549647 RepID=A0ABS5S0R7_9FLAO|nr:inorganic diphosphatase [Aequorivita echinoideorum]
MKISELNNIFLKITISFFTIIVFQSCDSAKKIFKTPTFNNSNQINCIIEIPAGTNKKIEFNKTSKKFIIDVREGKERIIEYLPYPGNYGFIASTFSDPQQGGDGDPLDVLVLCESLKTGTIVATKPIGILKLLDAGEMDYKVICIPTDKNLQTLYAETFDEFSTKYPNALALLENWFSSYDHFDIVKIEGWGDEKEALEEIQKLSIPIKK